MRELTQEELKEHPQLKSYLDWIPFWVEDALENCFDFCILELEPSETFSTNGKACILIDGCGTANHIPAAPETTFGFRQNDAVCEICSDTYQAETKSILLCFRSNIFDGTCFGLGCGSMHFRMQNMLKDAPSIHAAK